MRAYYPKVKTASSLYKFSKWTYLSIIHKLTFDVYHEARQTSQLFSPDRFRCFW